MVIPVTQGNWEAGMRECIRFSLARSSQKQGLPSVADTGGSLLSCSGIPFICLMDPPAADVGTAAYGSSLQLSLEDFLWVIGQPFLEASWSYEPSPLPWPLDGCCGDSDPSSHASGWNRLCHAIYTPERRGGGG